MKDWKSTTFGLISAAAAFTAFSPELFVRWPWVSALSKWVLMGGLAGLGNVARDASTSEAAHAADADKMEDLRAQVAEVAHPVPPAV